MGTGGEGAAFLLRTGGAVFCGEEGEQLDEYQVHGWRGLHPFLERFPDADVFLAGKGTGKIEVPEPMRLLDHIEEPSP